MSALHLAVARAIAYADWQAPPEIPIPVGARHDRMAAVAVGVVLAEARRSIEALSRQPIAGSHAFAPVDGVRLDEALAAVAALSRVSGVEVGRAHMTQYRVDLPADWRREGMVVIADSATGELLGSMGRNQWAELVSGNWDPFHGQSRTVSAGGEYQRGYEAALAAVAKGDPDNGGHA